MPAALGLEAPGYAESGVPGRATFYVELAGVPLDVLTQLRTDWREAYQKQLVAPDAFPLHNHKDLLRFPDPRGVEGGGYREAEGRARPLPAGRRLRRAQARQPRRGGGAGPRAALPADMGGGDLQAVGAERTLRRRGFAAHHRARLERLLAEAEGDLGSVRMLGASALFQFLSNRAYAKRRDVSFDQEERIGGVAHHVAAELARRWYDRARAQEGAGGYDPRSVREALFDRIADWTVPIEGSLEDVDALEANRDAADAPAMRAVDKRQVDRPRFTEATLRRVAGLDAEPAGAAGDAPPPPPPPGAGGPWYVNAPGLQQTRQDMAGLRAQVAAGALGPDTLVFDAASPGAGWATAGRSPGLADLFAAPPPPPPATAAFYVAQDGRTTGPFGADVLSAWAAGGRLAPGTPVCRVGAATWGPAVAEPELAGGFPPPPPPAPQG